MFHGKDAKGDGPAAAALRVSPANLTELAKKNNGKFPADHVATVQRSSISGAHESPEMPVWGPLFSDMSRKLVQKGLGKSRVAVARKLGIRLWRRVLSSRAEAKR
jgi:hypothetical protein